MPVVSMPSIVICIAEARSVQRKAAQQRMDLGRSLLRPRVQLHKPQPHRRQRRRHHRQRRRHHRRHHRHPQTLNAPKKDSLPIQTIAVDFIDVFQTVMDSQNTSSIVAMVPFGTTKSKDVIMLGP